MKMYGLLRLSLRSMNAVMLGQFASHFCFSLQKMGAPCGKRSKMLLDLDRLVMASQEPWELPVNFSSSSEPRSNVTQGVEGSFAQHWVASNAPPWLLVPRR